MSKRPDYYELNLFAQYVNSEVECIFFIWNDI